MRVVSFFLLIAVSFLSVEAAFAKQRKHIIIPKIGFYEMDNEYTAGYQFDTSSDSVYGFEYERRFSNGLTIGAEYLHFKNTIKNVSYNNELDVDIFLFNAKYYFNYDSGVGFLPFIGLGHGYAIGTDANDGQAYQIMGGLAYEWDRVGMYFQYMRMHSRIDRDSVGRIVAGGPEIDISGHGFFSGVTIKF